MENLTENQIALLRQAATDPDGRIDLSGNKPIAALSAVLGALRRKGLAEKDDSGRWKLTPAGREVAEASANDLIQQDAPAADTPTPDTPANENTEPDGPPAIDPGSRRGQILTLLRQEQGASMAGMMAATGWQAHSVRALLSSLRKGGLAVTFRKQAGAPSRYHSQTAGEGAS